MLTDGTGGSVTPDKFMAALHASLDPVVPLSQVLVTDACFVRAAAGGTTERVIGGDREGQDHSVAGTARPIPSQAHPVIAAAAKGDQWAFTLWLLPENGLKFARFNFTPARLPGKSPSDLIAMARAARQDRRHRRPRCWRQDRSRDHSGTFAVAER